MAQAEYPDFDGGLQIDPAGWPVFVRLDYGVLEMDAEHHPDWDEPDGRLEREAQETCDAIAKRARREYPDGFPTMREFYRWFHQQTGQRVD